MNYNILLREFKSIYGRQPYNNSEFYEFADSFEGIE
jgi:hypothetical protein